MKKINEYMGNSCKMEGRQNQKFANGQFGAVSRLNGEMLLWINEKSF
ncbi:MAG: hypothetical protein HXS46_20460 [Theionarchaea archaeon]|nr:hypothetical protein [Theionarchaea archaeon]